MSGTNWLDLSLSSNRHIRTYVQGFVDISGGNLIVRNNNLFVYGGDSSLNGRLLVSGDSSLNGTLTIGSTLYPTGGINLQNNLNMGGLINQSGTTVQGGVIYQPIVTSDVSAIINASNVYSNNMTLANNVYTIGNASNSVSIGVNKNPVTISGPLYALYDASINGRLFVTQDASMTGKLYVNSTTSLNSHLYIPGTSNIAMGSGAGSGSITFSDTNKGISYSGANSGNYFVNSNFPTDGLAIWGCTDGCLGTKGASTRVALSWNNVPAVGIGRTDPAFTLDVSGTTRTTGTLFVGGDASMNGNLSVGKDMNINGNLSVKQYKTNLTVYTVDYQLMVAQDLSVNGRLFMTGDASINNRLFVGGDVSMNGKVYMKGNVGIGTLVPQSALDVTGTINATAISSATTATTQATGDNSTKIATTAYVQNQGYATNTNLNLKAPLASPSFTGNVGIGVTNPQYTLDLSSASSAPLRVGVGATNALVVNSSGNVGIGTASPGYTLDVAGSAGVGGALSVTGATTLGTSYNNNTFMGTANGWGVFPSSVTSGTIRYNPSYVGAGTNEITAYFGAGTQNIMRLVSGPVNGQYVFFALGSQKIYLSDYTSSGTLTVDAGGRLVAGSDRRIKNNIVYLTDTNNLEKIKQLKPCSYYLNDSDYPNKKIGFIAQDLETVIPDAVDGKKYEYMWKVDENNKPIFDADGNLIMTDKIRPRNIDNTAILAFLVKGTQELAAIVESHQTLISNLEARLSALENK